MTRSIRPLLLGAAAALAAALPVASTAWAAPAHWTVDPAASKLAFTSSFSGAAIAGTFRKWSADIAFDPAQLPASSIKVTVDTASVASGDNDRDGSLKESDWFNAKAFPNATFVSTSIKAAGPNAYQAAGNLTLRGVTKPATLAFTLKITGDTADATGTLSLDRGQFGVGQGQFKGGEAIPLKVGVNTVIKATKAK